jgi:hypothetical protein
MPLGFFATLSEPTAAYPVIIVVPFYWNMSLSSMTGT